MAARRRLHGQPIVPKANVTVNRGARPRGAEASDDADGPTILTLWLRRPISFDFLPLQWVFLRVSEISLLEWHPFSLSSAPGDDEYFYDDDDNDNILDVDEIDGAAGSYRYDHDNDGIWDLTDNDDDNDGLMDWFEINDGNDLTGQFDADNDGLDDYEDDDDDNDGILDIFEL